MLIRGDRDDPLWLDYPGYDLPPLPKYLIAGALALGGQDRPGPAAARAWYADTSRRFVPPWALTVARVPSVLLGAAGCVAIFAIGRRAGGPAVGWFAALGLMLNPLYARHARRAMSDVPSEALILVTAAVGLWAWDRLLRGRPAVGPTLSLVFGAGAAAGLAVLAKLNGALGGFILAAWAVLGLALTGLSPRGRVGFASGCVGAGAVAVALFVAANPFVTANPPGRLSPERERVARLGWVDRLDIILKHRVDVSDGARKLFPHDALTTPTEKAQAVAVQGFGRFGPFGPRAGSDSTRRFDPAQDAGAWAWLPWVALGGVAALVRGRNQVRAGDPPTAWAVLAQAAVAMVVVTVFIPLAWDRYFLSIQPGSALLGALGLGAAWDAVAGRFVRSKPGGEP